MNRFSRSESRARRPKRAAWLAVVLFVLPVVASCAGLQRQGEWWQARRDSSAQAPDPAVTPEAVLQVYAARAVGWRGVLAVHTWIAVKPSGVLHPVRGDRLGG